MILTHPLCVDILSRYRLLICLLVAETVVRVILVMVMQTNDEKGEGVREMAMLWVRDAKVLGMWPVSRGREAKNVSLRVQAVFR